MPDRNTHGLYHHGLAAHHHHCHHGRHDLDLDHDDQVVSRGGGEGDQLLVDGGDQPQGVEVTIRNMRQASYNDEMTGDGNIRSDDIMIRLCYHDWQFPISQSPMVLQQKLFVFSFLRQVIYGWV